MLLKSCTVILGIMAKSSLLYLAFYAICAATVVQGQNELSSNFEPSTAGSLILAEPNTGLLVS
jgi:hypothetical protein